MEHEGIQPHQSADDQRHGDDRDHQRHGIGRSIRPGTAVPPTVLIADMGDGSLFLQGWRDGPSVYLSRSDAMPLRQELAGAFGSTGPALSGGQGEALRSGRTGSYSLS